MGWYRAGREFEGLICRYCKQEIQEKEKIVFEEGQENPAHWLCLLERIENQINDCHGGKS